MLRLRLYFLVFLLGCLFCASTLLAQQAVDPRNRYERLICIVPMIGSGTYEDPRRPVYALTDQDREQLSPGEGILGYSFILSDDEQWALVEFVATDRKAFARILSDAKGELTDSESPIPFQYRQEFRVFEKGKVTRASVEKAFRKFKPNLNLDTLGVSLP
ncbi:MAG TPA: hypothetical protein VMW38_03930 [Terriglobia bacterium]|nr:hypothetical protein [Terriglobia bacterium]